METQLITGCNGAIIFLIIKHNFYFPKNNNFLLKKNFFVLEKLIYY